MTNPPHLSLYYVDTRASAACDSPLSLIETVRPEDRTSITRFHRPQDRHMALASTILKYLFIHRTAKVPWSEIVISRTPAPHKRPFWDPATAASPHPDRPGAVEFNVSHQAGLVALAGCETSSPPSTVTTPTTAPPEDGLAILGGPSSSSSWSSSWDVDPPPRIGIDITCVSEPSRGPHHITTASQFCDWVDIFAEVFSPAEMADMKSYYPPPPTPTAEPVYSPPPPHPSPPSSPPNSYPTIGEGELVIARLRRFYTFWALKEAYIKMTGEALLAGWLRELEFRNVKAPDVADDGGWGKVQELVEVFFRGAKVEGSRIEVVGFGRDYIVALVGRGLDDQGMLMGRGIRKVDVEREVKACAGGSCACLVT